MKKSGIISLIALLIALTGLLIALAAYFKRKKCVICDGFEDDMMEDDGNEYFSAHYDNDAACDCQQDTDEDYLEKKPAPEPAQTEEDADPSRYE